MRARSVSLRKTESKPVAIRAFRPRARVASFPFIVDPKATSRERALARFAEELSPAHGPEFFELLVEFVAECLGFDVVVIAELPAGGDGQLRPVATYPANARANRVMSALIGSHCDRLVETGFSRLDQVDGRECFNLPISSAAGRPLGVICGIGRAAGLDDATMSMLCRIVADRAAAEIERLRAQREAERRDALVIGLIAETHDVVAVVDADGTLSSASPAIERVLGYPADGRAGLTITDLVHPLDRELVESLLRISGGQGYSVEARLRRQDGVWLTMAVTVAEHCDADGRAFKVLSARDLTDQRRLEDRLRQSQKTETIGRMVTGIAHDFGNILMVLRSHADVMRLRTAADDPRHSSVDAIEEAVLRGADLARQLLAFSRHREFELKRIDLNTAVEQSTALLRRLVGSSIRLETRLSADARYVAADPTQIEQIILNLTLNARDAMPNGGTITFVTGPVNGAAPLPAIVAAAPDAYVEFSVTDTGCGISEAVLPHIFEPLFTTKSEGAGTGIGLATVHDIVSRHSGCIEVTSKEGQGSTFRVFLRRTVAPVARA
jgi:PAS domain S-box-containing protein